MATIKAIVRKGKSKLDGTTKINIAVCHKTKTVYIPTDIICEEKYFVNGMVVGGKNKNAINSVIISVVSDYKEKLSRLDNVEFLDASQIKERLLSSKKTKYSMLSEAKEEWLNSVTSINSRKHINLTYQRILSYNNGKDMYLDAIDTSYVSGLYRHLQTAKSIKGTVYSMQTVKSYMLTFKRIIDLAIKRGAVRYDIHPFSDIKLEPDVTKENFATLDDIIKLRGYEPTSKSEKFAKDMVLLSFYLGGMNLVDMIKADFSGDKVVYKRTKILKRTGGRYTVKIPICSHAREIIDEYITDNGMIDINRYGVFWSPLEGKNIELIVHNAYMLISTKLKRISENIGLNKNFTYYSARKVFAQVGLNLGIADNVIDYILGHTPNRRGVINAYSTVNEELAEIAMELIIEYSFKPTDLKTIFRKNILSMLKG